MATVAILCIARNEHPFAEEWLEYHFSLGSDRVYWISTDEDHAAIEALIGGSEYASRVKLFRSEPGAPGWQMQLYNRILPHIVEDWVLVLDLDEFLYLHDDASINDTMNRFESKVGQVQFPWLNLFPPLDLPNAYAENCVLEIASRSRQSVSDHVKSIVRRDCATHLGIHNHTVEGKVTCLSSGTETENGPHHGALLESPTYFEKHPFVLHFCSRGHWDVINRIVGHRFFSNKNGPKEIQRLSSYLTDMPNWGNMPNRYLMLLFYLSLREANVRLSLPALKARTDKRALEALVLEHLENIVDFECAPAENLAEAFEQKFGLCRKLASLDVSSGFDLEEYASCNTQITYLETKLRPKLLEASV